MTKGRGGGRDVRVAAYQAAQLRQVLVVLESVTVEDHQRPGADLLGLGGLAVLPEALEIGDAKLAHVQHLVVKHAAEHQVVRPLFAVAAERCGCGSSELLARNRLAVARTLAARDSGARARAVAGAPNRDASFLSEKNSSELASSNGRMSFLREKCFAKGFFTMYRSFRSSVMTLLVDRPRISSVAFGFSSSFGSRFSAARLDLRFFGCRASVLLRPGAGVTPIALSRTQADGAFRAGDSCADNSQSCAATGEATVAQALRPLSGTAS